MTKKDFQIVVNELRNDVSYPDVDTTPLHGCGLNDYPKRKVICKEVIVQFLRWQCLMMNGNIDEQELNYCLEIFRDKKIVMI